MFGRINESPLKDSTIKKRVKSSSKSRKISKSLKLRELLIRLFGSPLDDIEIGQKSTYSPQKLNKNRRRSLPVSINITDDDFLKPLKVSKKRKSENDAYLSSLTECKVSRFELKKAAVCELADTEFTYVSEFVKVEKENISATAVFSETAVAVVMDKPKIKEEYETEAVVSNLIDLTGESSPKLNPTVPLPMSIAPIVLQNGIKIEVLDSPQPSEKANAPAQGVSMPLLSPVSPAEATQSEATLPETSRSTKVSVITSLQATNNSSQHMQTVLSQRPPPNITITAVPPNKTIPQVNAGPPNKTIVPMGPPNITIVPVGPPNQAVTQNLSSNTRSFLQEIMQQYSEQEKNQSQNANETVRNGISPSGGGVYQVQNQQQSNVPTTQSHTINKSLANNTKRMRPLAPKRQQQSVPTVQQSTSQQQHAMSTKQQSFVPLQNVAMPATVHHQIQTPTTQPLPTQQLPNYQQSMTSWNQQQYPPAPKLIRLYMPPRDGYHLLSSTAFVQRVFPHLYTFTQWRENAVKFCQNMQAFLSHQIFKENYSAFNVYAVHTMETFGKKLIQDLSTVEVTNFNLNEIALLLAGKLQEKSLAMNKYRVCMHFYSMLQYCEKSCNTPFTQKFFKHIKVAVEQIEKRTQPAQAAISPFQPSQLRQLELQIQQYLLIRNWTNAHLSRVSFTINVNNNTQMSSRPFQANQNVPLRQTVLQNLLQKTYNSDRTGESDNHSPRSNYYTINSSLPDKSAHAPQQIVPDNSSSNDNLRCENRPQNKETSSSVPSEARETSVPAEIAEVCSSKENQNDCKPVVTDTCNSAFVNREVSDIIDLSDDTPVKVEGSGVVNNKRNDISGDEVIDLTWIDDGDEAAIIEEVTNHRAFPFKTENSPGRERDTPSREVVSPADSGLGSPMPQVDSKDVFTCFCGEKAIYVCACNSSMYCSRECQIGDWADHQRWCQEMKN